MASQNMAPPSEPRSMSSRQPLHRASGSTSTTSGSYYKAFQADTQRLRGSSSDGRGGDKKRWLGSLKDWLSVSEPSAQAMKTQKRETYKKHGVDPKDPAAAAKMHLPLGTLPPGATTSTSGPTPEKRLARELQSRPQHLKHGSTQSVSSGRSSSSAAPSIREINHVAPWEN